MFRRWSRVPSLFSKSTSSAPICIHPHIPRPTSCGPSAALTQQHRSFTATTSHSYRRRDTYTPTHSRKPTTPKIPSPYDVGRPYARARGIPLPQRSNNNATSSSASRSQSGQNDADTPSHIDDLTLPVAFPGSPGGTGGAGGGGLFQITKTPLFDAALTTIIGLGMGAFFVSPSHHHSLT